MRDYAIELKNRVAFIQAILKESGASGIVYGNSGGKDSSLVGILCKKACENTLGLIMPCGSKRNYLEDKTDAETVAKQFDISIKIVDLTQAKEELIKAAEHATKLTDMALANIAPRLRMTTLYAVAASENRIVSGTGNKSEIHMGYFTKWGDGACDFNPIADLTVTEIYEFLLYLKAPECVIEKAPSAGLFDGQTDEKEMGVTYKSIDDFLLNGVVSKEDKAIIDDYHAKSIHKVELPQFYKS